MGAISFYRREVSVEAPQSPWMEPEEMRAFSSGDVTRDVILGDGASLAFLDPVPWELGRNANVAVVGGSGSGKTRSFAFPNLVNHMANYVITDTKRELFRATADGFARDGYEVLCLDSVDLARSCRFDPLRYVASEEDVSPVVEMILDSISPGRDSGSGGIDPFWEQAASLLMRALADFERVISIVRSRGINFLLCLQSVSQLRYVYGAERAAIILDNCDAFVYMGAGSSYESAEYMSRLCGTAEVGTRLVGVERRRMGISENVISASSVARLPRTDCIVRLPGARPFLTRKYDVTRHPNAGEFLRLVDGGDGPGAGVPGGEGGSDVPCEADASGGPGAPDASGIFEEGGVS